MIAKEWRDARWKFLIALVLVVLWLFLLTPYDEFVAETMKYAPNEDPGKDALYDIGELYYVGGFFVLLPLAAFLGVASVSAEVNNGTILLLLSRPVSRTRLLLSKYAVGAATLLIAAVSGKLLLIAAAAVRGYPVGQLGIMEAMLSVVVLWLGVLFVLGTALLISTIFRSIIASILACALTLFLIFALPTIGAEFYPWGYPYELSLRLTLLTYWMPTYYYYPNDFYGIGGFALTNFLVCLIVAALPLLASLCLFNRKAY
jgi:ABC-2 type transport system permease protein